MTRVSNPRTAPPLPEPDPSDRSAPGASTMEAPHQSLFQKGPKPAQLQVRLLSHILASSLSAQKAASSLPSNPMPTCPCPVLTGHRSCAFLHGVCHACQRVTNAGEQESGAPRSVLAASRETSSRASKREQAPTAETARHPVLAPLRECVSGEHLRIACLPISLCRSLRTGGARPPPSTWRHLPRQVKHTGSFPLSTGSA